MLNQSTWKKWSMMAVKSLKYWQLNTSAWNKHFRSSTQSWALTLFSLNRFVISVVESACPQPLLFVIWDLKIANYQWLVLHKTYSSNLMGNLCLFCEKVCGFIAGLRRHESIMRTMSMGKTAILFVTHTTQLARIYLAWRVMYTLTCVLR